MTPFENTLSAILQISRIRIVYCSETDDSAESLHLASNRDASDAVPEPCDLFRRFNARKPSSNARRSDWLQSETPETTLRNSEIRRQVNRKHEIYICSPRHLSQLNNSRTHLKLAPQVQLDVPNRTPFESSKTDHATGKSPIVPAFQCPFGARSLSDQCPPVALAQP